MQIILIGGEGGRGGAQKTELIGPMLRSDKISFGFARGHHRGEETEKGVRYRRIWSR